MVILCTLFGMRFRIQKAPALLFHQTDSFQVFLCGSTPLHTGISVHMDSRFLYPENDFSFPSGSVVSVWLLSSDQAAALPAAVLLYTDATAPRKSPQSIPALPYFQDT